MYRAFRDTLGARERARRDSACAGRYAIRRAAVRGRPRVNCLNKRSLLPRRGGVARFACDRPVTRATSQIRQVARFQVQAHPDISAEGDLQYSRGVVVRNLRGHGSKMPRVNPEILRWARETAGLEPEEAAHKIGLRAARGATALERLAALEAGEGEPTRPLLVRMAKQYRRSLLTFYLPVPPARGDRGEDFRTLPIDHSDTDEALLDALIRDVRARQSLVRAVLEDEEGATPLSFVGSMAQTAGAAALAESIRETLVVSLREFRAAPSTSEAFNLLRSKAEDAGIFVLLIGNLGSHHTAISLETFRGFAVADRLAPFVIINDQDSRAAWSFTLLHELAHIWLGQTGVSGGSTPGRGIERFCNDVAGEFLLPTAELGTLDLPRTSVLGPLAAAIDDFASERNISRSMVAYKLLRQDRISLATWSQLSNYFREEWLANREHRRELNRTTAGGPSFYTVRRHRLGFGLIRLVRRMLSAGELTTAKAGKVLGVRAKQVQSVIDVSATTNRAY